MQILPEFIGCVAFLCERDKDDRIRPGGTAFFVEVDDDAGKHKGPWIYLVTSAHSFDFIGGDTVYVRMNTHQAIKAVKDFEDIQTRKADWVSHDMADVAAISAPADPTRHKFERIPVDTFINRDYRLDVSRFRGRGRPEMEELMMASFPGGIPVEVGHELYFPGLFVQSAGQNANLPIVRFGHIARMPGDELLTLESPARKMKIRGYLAESHSWGGHSGFPVFWRFEYEIKAPIDATEWAKPESPLSITRARPPRTGRLEVVIGTGWAQGLMGLISGHYEIPRKDKNRELEVAINSGIAIVTPAENIRELLMRDDFVEDRKRRAEQIEPTATADFASGSRTRQTGNTEIPPISRTGFVRALKKTTQRNKPS